MSGCGDVFVGVFVSLLWSGVELGELLLLGMVVVCWYVEGGEFGGFEVICDYVRDKGCE